MDIAPAASDPNRGPLTVSELSQRILFLLEGQIGQAAVVGEVSNVRLPASGHCYFLLKDAGAAINAVCFRGVLRRQTVRLRDGMQVEVAGRVTAYTQRSEYQIIVDSIREAGVGQLMQRFLELKEKLKAEGLFDLARKRAIPRLPRVIGLVTSPSGAAVRDMLNVLNRRVRGLAIYLAPAAVQGEAAPLELIAALERLQRHGRAEVIIIGRGGGSIEDLWSFNDERLVRAIAACSIPVISAVGHETDTTLADFAADLRAPTPSAAAELVSAHYGELDERFAQVRRRLTRAVSALLAGRRARLRQCSSSWGLRKPVERLNMASQRLDDLRESLLASAERLTKRRGERLRELAGRLERGHPRRRIEVLRARLAHGQAQLLTAGPARWRPRIAQNRQQLDQWQGRLALALELGRQRRRLSLQAARQRLESSNPSAILRRGYSIVTHGRKQQIVTRPDQTRQGETVHIQSAGGPWRAAVLPPEADLFDMI